MTQLFRTIFAVLLACAALWHLTGCTTHGHRKVSLEIMGSTISVEDQTYADNEGQRDYSATFDEDNNIVKWLLGWMNPQAESDGDEPADEAADEAATETAKFEEPDAPPGG